MPHPSETTLSVNGQSYHYFAINSLDNPLVKKLPVSIKVLLENQLRHHGTHGIDDKDIQAFFNWAETQHSDHEIAYKPARVLMQDFTGVPAVVDLAAMRDAMANMGGDTQKINPLCPVDLVIDHSVQVDSFGARNALQMNVDKEMERNNERYSFLKWGQHAFENFRVVPPGTGICHQVNLEYLAQVAWQQQHGDKTTVYPDTLVGTDSHTTMINGLGVLGWGVGGIEAEAAMLGQPISMLIPDVVGFKLVGELPAGTTATDLVLTVTNRLREKGVVGKFVEFYGPGLHHLTLADRATLANMAPEYGATCGFFPVDEQTIHYLNLTNRDPQTVALVEAYAKAQGFWHDKDNAEEPLFSDTCELDLSTVVPSVAGPKRPQDKVALTELTNTIEQIITENHGADALSLKADSGDGFELQHGDVAIAAITSCTNTSNPGVMIAAGILAKKAQAFGLSAKPWVKTSLAPGSKVVTEYLEKTGLLSSLEAVNFFVVGYGCTTCIGNSGPLPDAVAKTIDANKLTVCGVLSGNRNFEGRIHPQVTANWIASPPLVVAYALAGTTRIDITSDPLAQTADGKDVYLKDIWPTSQEIADAMAEINQGMFATQYADVFDGDDSWKAIPVDETSTYNWDEKSTYVRLPPFFEGMTSEPNPIEAVKDARILAMLGDSVTTDHISPAGAIKSDSPAGDYLKANGVPQAAFNSYGSRRGNHEVMMRGTFANIRIRNELCPGVEGGYTRYLPSNEQMPIYDAAMRYQADHTPLVIIAGKEYGTGSSRDWAAKGTQLQGVKAVIAESFERIHRSNLIGMGVLPLQFPQGVDRHSLSLTGDEHISLDLSDSLHPGDTVTMTFTQNGERRTVDLLCRIDTGNELEYFRNGGILSYVLRQMNQG